MTFSHVTTMLYTCQSIKEDCILTIKLHLHKEHNAQKLLEKIQVRVSEAAKTTETGSVDRRPSSERHNMNCAHVISVSSHSNTATCRSAGVHVYYHATSSISCQYCQLHLRGV